MRFVAVDLLEASDLKVGIVALVDRAEREAIFRSRRMRWLRRVVLGRPKGGMSTMGRQRRGHFGRPYNANAFARDLAQVVADIRAAGHTSLRDIAAELTVRGIRNRPCRVKPLNMSAQIDFEGEIVLGGGAKISEIGA